MVGVGDHYYHGGKEALLLSDYSGRLSFGINDNLASDNDGFWNVEYDIGSHVKQDVLVVVQEFTGDKADIEREVNEFVDFIKNNSGHRLKLNATIFFSDKIIESGEYMPFEDGFVPFNTNRIFDYLSSEGYNAKDYQSIIRIYTHSTGPGSVKQPSRNVGLTWNKKSPQEFTLPWVTTIIANNTNYANPGGTTLPYKSRLVNVLVHEYLHAIDNMFEGVGIMEFANPDNKGDAKKNKITFIKQIPPKGATIDELKHLGEIENMDYYEKMMMFLEDGNTTVNYIPLSERFGKLTK
jgi:hypothetical protein